MRLPSTVVRSLVLLGFLPSVAGAAEMFTAIQPCRIVDTRAGFGGVVQSGAKRNFTVTGGVTVPGFPTCTIPSTARAVALNVIAVGPTADGFLALWPSSASSPGASTLNVQAGQVALANGAIVELNFGTLTTEPSLSLVYGTAVSGTTHIVIDVTGYLAAPEAPFSVMRGPGWGATLGDSGAFGAQLGLTAIGAVGVYATGNTAVDAHAVAGGTAVAAHSDTVAVSAVIDSGTVGIGVSATGKRYGVLGSAPQFGLRGIVGTASSNYGDTFVGSAAVYGDSASSVGLYGTSDSNVGVAGVSKTKWGIYGAGGAYAGYFDGNVHVNGTLSKAAGSFKIDHPLDPENKYLYHSFVESPEMMNVYDGNVVLGPAGRAVVELPEWFEALNGEFRYQLTSVGGFAPVYVSREIADHRFEIAGGRPGLKVSWLVTGVRHDPYAEHHRIPVEEDKPADERGSYLDPADYGQPAEKGLSPADTAHRPPG